MTAPSSPVIDVGWLEDLAAARDPGIPESVSVAEKLTACKALETILLKQTLDFAQQRVPFYRETWKKHGLSSSAFRRTADIRAFPVLHKSDLEANRRDFIASGIAVSRMSCTSGTTARRLTVYGNADEDAALNAMVRARSHPAEDPSICLRVLPAMRRTVRSSPVSNGHLVVNVTYFAFEPFTLWFDSTDQMIQLLLEEHFLSGTPKRVSVIHITPPFLLEFMTARFGERSFDPSTTSVRDIAVSGGFVFDHLRELVRAAWNATCHSSYSCTEINGEALECPLDPAVFHIGPTMHAEVVDPMTFAEVAPGEHGVLLLTALYPFQQVMPFVRYNTGDIVERIDPPCACGSVYPAIRPIGRLPHCVDLSDVLGRRAYLGTRHVGDVAGRSSVIPRLPYPRYELRRSSPGEGRAQVDLILESRDLSVADRETSEAALASDLIKTCGFAREALSSGVLTFAVKLEPKGTLNGFFHLYPDR